MVPKDIDRAGVQRLIDRGVQIVDVLPANEYAEQHLPGAISIPLKRLNAESVSGLDRNTPVIVYCWDVQWDMSPRAAWRLESLGFQEVYDYVAGEADWFANGLPMEGTNAAIPHAGDLATHGYITCRLDENLQDAARRLRESGYDACPVVNDEQIVLGLLWLDKVNAAADGTVEQFMESGPSTWRLDATLDQPLAYMERRKVESVIITTSDGRLVGLLRRSDIEDHRTQAQ